MSFLPIAEGTARAFFASRADEIGSGILSTVGTVTFRNIARNSRRVAEVQRRHQQTRSVLTIKRVATKLLVAGPRERSGIRAEGTFGNAPGADNRLLFPNLQRWRGRSLSCSTRRRLQNFHR